MACVATGFLSFFHSTIYSFISFLSLFLLVLYFLNFSFNSMLSFCFFFTDEVSFFMVFILVIVIFYSSFYLFSVFNLSFSLLLMFLIVVFCFLVFSTSSLLLLYVSYELSLLPIIFIIIIWGSYPERSVSSIMLLVYTSVFTIPFLFVLFYVYSVTSSFFLFYTSVYSLSSEYLSFIFFFVFAVKLPIYGLHFWLPIAHVEAPTFGSIVLAGVLLKLGGVGLLRCYHFIDFSILSYCLFSYFVLFLAYVPIVCAIQSDFNRLVAYSSVSHIMVIPILLFILVPLSLNTSILVLLFHGISSPLLFSLVGYCYSLFSSRQFVSMRGSLIFSPLVSFILISAFLLSVCVPPFPSFVSEVFFFICAFSLWSLIFLFLVLFAFLSIVYNISWLSAIVFSSQSTLNYEKSFCTFSFTLSSLMLLLISLAFILLVSFLWGASQVILSNLSPNDCFL